MKFEYKILKIAKDVLFKSKNDPTVNTDKPEEFENALNELGKEGWEMVGVIDPRGYLGLGSEGYCLFKRSLE